MPHSGDIYLPFMSKKFPLIIIGLLVVFTAGIFLLHQQNPAFDYVALLVGNVFFAVLTLMAFGIAGRSVGKPALAFSRGVMTATMVKMFVFIAAILGYALLNKPHLHKPTLIVLFVIYAIYTVMETVQLQRMARQQAK